jgi:cobalt-zinc-cadmium efflux system outer membrane protein
VSASPFKRRRRRFPRRDKVFFRELNFERRIPVTYSAKASIILGTVIILTIGPGRAAPPEDALTLEKAVEIALSRNPSVLFAQAEVRAASARRLQTEARPDPTLELGTAGIPFGLKKDEGRETEVEIGVQKTFEFPGKRSYRIEIGRYGEDIAALELERVRLVLSARVRKAYLRVVRSDQALERLAAAVGLLDRVIEAVQVRYAAGRAAYADVLRARVDKARLRNQAIEERRERQAAAAELNLLLGRPTSEPFTLLSGIEAPTLVRSIEDIRTAALSERPSIKIAALRVEQAAAAEGLAGLNQKPDLTAGLYVPSKRFSAWGFSLGLTLPLSGKRWAGERAEAAAIRESSLAAVDGLRRRLSVMIDSAYESLLLAEEQIHVFERQLLAEIEDELKVSLDLYALGKIEAYALLDLYRAAAEARLEHLQAVYNGAVARIDLDIAGEDIS